jgi:hypothetical protein
MNTALHAQLKAAPLNFMPVQNSFLQRKCACGSPTSSLSGDCAQCNGKLQNQLAVGSSNDHLEQEADRVADQVLAGPGHPASRGESIRVQRFTGQSSEGMETVPPSVHRVLAGSGRPVEPTLREEMEQRFGHDFTRVRVHAGGAAEQSAQEVNANAYTVGHHIVFGATQFSPGTNSGRRLIAHELTHVVQQSGGPSLLSAQKKKAPPKKLAPKVPQICGRNSRKVAGNSITKVNIDVGTNELTIEWKDPTKIPPGSAGSHAISPGAGLCCVDCNDTAVSQTQDTLCTPKGGEWPVDSTGCVLSARHPTARNATFFQRPTIAIHRGNVDNPPQSHGCSRTTESISELIHDNVIPQVTKIASSGTWTSNKCYVNAKTDTLSNRKDVCDGNKLKSKPAGKQGGKKTKQPGGANAPEEIPPSQTPPRLTPPSAIPVAEAPLRESEELATVELPEMIADGPGPNNDPPSQESIGEIPLEDLDLTVEGGDLEDESAFA